MQLGFKLTDIKLITSTHGHWDHVGDLAEFQKVSKARVLMSERDAPVLESGGNLDYRRPEGRGIIYDPIKVDQRLKDGDKFRLEESRQFGATDTVDASSSDVLGQLKSHSRDGLGVDVAIEAVGIPATFALALDSIRPGGRVANIGVHGEGVNFPIERDWINNITITTGLVNATTAPQLLEKITAGEIDPGKFITHRFTFDQMMQAYDTFARAADEHALKVIITNEG